MKTLVKPILGLLVILTIIEAQDKLPSSSEVKEYDKIFEKIAERRSGADSIMIDKLENPFIILSSEQNASESNATAQAPAYVLEAIFNQKAKINGNWYKKNDLVGSYMLIKITYNSVILQNEIEKKRTCNKDKR
ncbi:hypothetical protein Sdiek1_1541 [Sulfurospirillum diekertiae]|uniref:Uncharacterized protein n=1 Tax=Sulfurospirillum diekertiae TaxID=1854492 RepID=A0A1Y0HMV9_9BACT|nr:hypothetical protein [Sulfurospirillum diekertiae]ARU48704.1 hypothetical protein Sdiek1_1541 [Sulfurospirillum diekertiae]